MHVGLLLFFFTFCTTTVHTVFITLLHVGLRDNQSLMHGLLARCRESRHLASSRDGYHVKSIHQMATHIYKIVYSTVWCAVVAPALTPLLPTRGPLPPFFRHTLPLPPLSPPGATPLSLEQGSASTHNTITQLYIRSQYTGAC